jgi:RNA polymerase-binding transcription factor DksA
VRGEDDIRDQLEQRLAKLLHRTGKIEADLRKPGNRDWTERATELENEEVLRRLDEAEVAEIGDIRAALARLDDGSYGTCQRCGGRIKKRRLATLPFTRTCISCAEEAAEAAS